MNKFGAFIRKERLNKNLGLREFADMINLSPTFISKMEVGDYKPPKEENIVKMANILGGDKDYYLAMANKISEKNKLKLINEILGNNDRR